MAERLFLASMEPRAGRSLVTLGLMELLTARFGSVGYVRPVGASSGEPDPRIALVTDRYPLDADQGELAAYGWDEVGALMADGRGDELFQRVLEVGRRIEKKCDFVLYDGTDYLGAAPALEFAVNARIAVNLGAPVLALVSGREHEVDDVVDAVRILRESLTEAGCAIAGTIVNRVDPEVLDEVRSRFGDADPDGPVWCVPEVPLIAMPTVREVFDGLGAELVAGAADGLDREVTSVKIAAMSLPHVLSYVDDGSLLIVPGDRPDVVLGALVSRLATTFPDISALILTGGFPLHPNIRRLLDGLSEVPVPILAVDEDTFTTAQAVAAVPAVIRPRSTRKIDLALEVFAEHVDVAALTARIEASHTERVTPLMFQYDLVERVRAERRHIVLPEGDDERILRACAILAERDIVDLTLLGDEATIRDHADAIGLDLGGTRIVDPARSELREQFAATYHHLRAHKGVSLASARETLLDVSYFGTLMVHEGLADGMVSGAAHTTQHTIRPAFEVIRTTPGVSIVSSVFLMLLGDRVLVYGDCAVNPTPDAEQLADIAISSAETAEAFGIEPRIAMLSYSTGISGKGETVEDVRRATALVRERRPELAVDGPIQYDAAVDVAVGEAKMPGSDVAGRATVFIFPDLNTGNNTYKAVQRSAGAVAIGPLLQGLNRPVNDLSRGCLVTDVVNTILITAVQAQHLDTAGREAAG